ncbi:hypothetical protein ABT147_29645 [Streptomyces sp. NPDC001868]|uniref:hypothetical protein n=1 Tax=Streptomyces sp. NPDC001868 TaxID=3154401 RepID=UPI0033299CAC
MSGKKRAQGGDMMPRRRKLSVVIPSASTVSGCAVVTGSSTLGASVAAGRAPTEPGQIWPLVVLTVATMLYDLGRRALRRRRV